MPRAVNIATTERHDLKSLEDGFVVIRRMNQGEKMQRQGKMSGMKVTGSRKSRDFQGELELANQRVTEFEFATCVVEHNLEDEDGRPLNLASTVDLAKLDGKVGEEISTYIDKLNQFTEDDEEGE
jgi:hypothetical protein